MTVGIEAAQPAAPTHVAADRLGWIDAAKGAGIVLVVFGHVWRGLQAAGLLADGPLYETVDRAVYLFHMPLFFIVSGFLFQMRPSRSTTGFVARMLTKIVWPLWLWTAIYFSVKLAAGGATNAPVQLSEFPIIPLPPVDHFWFLWALLVIQVAAFIYLKLSDGQTTALLAALVVASVASLIATVPEPLAPYLWQALAFAPFFLVGMVLQRTAWEPQHVGALWLPLAVFATAEFIAIALGKLGGVAELLLSLAAAVAFFLAFAALRSCSQGRGMQWLKVLGRASMAIYVAHIIFTAATRIALSSAGISDVAVHVVVGTAVGILGPLAMYLAAKRARLERLAGF